MSTDYKQFDVAIDVSKQLLTLAAAIVTLTVAFWKDIVGVESAGTADRVVIGLSWGSYSISILAGIACLYGINGSVSALSTDPSKPRSIYDSNVATFMGAQQITFLLGLVLTVAFGVLTL